MRWAPSTWAAAAVLLVVLLLAGCGSDDEGSDGDNNGNGDAAEAFPPHVVRDSDIEAQEDGSPERALLEWWQGFQFADAAAVTAATSPQTLDAIGERNLAALVKKRGQGLQGIEVLSGTENGNTASIRAGLLTFQPEKKGAPPPTTPTASKPATFSMTKQGNKWLFNETAFLEPMVANMKQAKRKQKQQTETGTTGTEATDTQPSE